MILPKYPVYVPSKGRCDVCLTAKFLTHDSVPFTLVVEAPEAEQYQARFPSATIVVLPFVNAGLIAARNFIKDHATTAGAERHWQLDDNMRQCRRWFHNKRIRCQAGVALRVTEDFVDRYENVAIAGLNYTMFAHSHGRPPKDPFWLNCHVYSCTLIDNRLPFSWRLTYNDDTDLCLQVLAAGYCTILMNAFMVDKLQTMTVKGGNTSALYQGDGRLMMARSLERQWPGVVETKRRWRRPQHVVKDAWRKFDTQLIKKANLTYPDDPEYGLTLVQKKPSQSQQMREIAQHG